MSDPILTRLANDIDMDHTFLLARLADRHEELGEPWLAAAYRWLAEQRKWPMHLRDLWEWQSGDVDCGWGYVLHKSIYRLFANRPGVVGYFPNQFRTPSEALRAAAEAVATTLQQ